MEAMETSTHAVTLVSVEIQVAYCVGPAEIVGLNPTVGMDVCLLWVLCVVR
jgi:hypothetical protein